MALRLRNTLTRGTEPVVPLPADEGGTPGLVRIYTCGPTVYRYAHVGNLRTFLFADLVRRVLGYHGLRVLHVKNITDVGHMRDERRDGGGDRIEVQAELEGRSTREIADHYEAAFRVDEAAVNILPAHHFPRATDHIPEMVALAERLEDRGLAYRSDEGTLYFDVARFPEYGRLSGNSLDELRAGHRGEVEPDKRDPADFALWKPAGPGRLMHWPTERWGEGFPGWHLECSAMAAHYLGERFELHTGGEDNVFPHHEDEIAQSAGATGRVPARHWGHAAHLLMSGQKMAKSAGNLQRITDLADAGIDPLAFRYLTLTARYRHRLELTDVSIRGAASALDSLRARLRALGPAPEHGPWAAPSPVEPATPDGVTPTDRAHAPVVPLSAAGRGLHGRFVDAIDDDLDLPVALATVREALRSDLSADERRWLVLDADAVLGLDLHRVWDERPEASLPGPAAGLLAERERARAERDYERADGLREQLRELGVEPVDGAAPTEPGWRAISPAAPDPGGDRSGGVAGR